MQEISGEGELVVLKSVQTTSMEIPLAKPVFNEEMRRAAIEVLSSEKKGDSGVTVVIPTLNEEGSIQSVIKRLRQLGYNDVLIVDGNSNDRTVHVARSLGANVVFQNGLGKGAALRQAFDHDALSGNTVVMMDADGSMNPEEIPQFIKTLNHGADIVKGSRFLSNGYSEDMSLLRRIGNWILLFLVNLLWSAGYTDLCYGFAVFRSSALVQLRPTLRSKNFEIETEVFIKAKKMGLRVAEAPSVELRRRYGKSNLSCFKDGFCILRTIIQELLTESAAKEGGR